MFLQYFWVSNHSLVEDVFQKVWPAIQQELGSKWLNTNRSKKELALKNILVNLLACPLLCKEDPCCVVVSRSKDHYRSSQYRACHFKYRVYVPLFDVLVKDGWCEQKKGFNNRQTGGMKRTRLVPTEKLLKYGMLSPVHISNTNPNILELRDKEKIPIAFHETPYTRAARKKLNRYNSFIANQNITFPLEEETGMTEKKKEEENYSPLHNSVHIATTSGNDINNCLKVRRIFNGDFEHGGRHYGIYQSLGKDARLNLLIRGRPVVELDFKAMHPTMLYHLSELEAPKDCYAIFGDQRDKRLRPVIKLAFNILLNAKSFPSAIAAFLAKPVPRGCNADPGIPISGFLHSHNLDAGSLMREIIQFHQPIAEEFATGMGLELQFMEAEIMANILEECCSADIPALPVHDSIIVPENQANQAKQIMATTYEKRFAFSIAIKAETNQNAGHTTNREQRHNYCGGGFFPPASLARDEETMQ